MMFRSLDNTGDWTFGSGKSNYSRGLDALKLDLKTRLRCWKNDCFFALGLGVDYNSFLDRGTQFLLEQDIRRVIFQTEGVIRIEKYESEPVTDLREYQATVTIQTIYGRISIDGFDPDFGGPYAPMRGLDDRITDAEDFRITDDEEERVV